MVSLQDTTLSTRRGNVVFLDDVLQRAIEKAAEIMREKNPGLEDCEETAKHTGWKPKLYARSSVSCTTGRRARR